MQKVSIITINLNNHLGLRRTIESVLSQTYSNYELIVIDGGSGKEDLSVIEEFAGKIHQWVSEKDNGVFDAQNKGLAKATGDYLLVLNSGDELFSPSVLSDLFSRNRTADIVYGNMQIVHPDGSREFGKMPSAITFEHMMKDTLWHPVSFVRRDFFVKVGYYDLSYRIISDYKWFLRAIFLNHAQLEYEDKTISVFYLGGLSSQLSNKARLLEERRRAQVSVFGKEKVKAFENRKQVKVSFIKRLIHKLFS